MDNDNLVDLEDHRVWVEDLKNTWFGDANLNLEFDSGDLVAVFAAGKYETGGAATWAEGDWTADGLFSSSDLVSAFAGGGYNVGPRPAAAAVPEPTSVMLWVLGMLMIVIRNRRSAR